MIREYSERVSSGIREACRHDATHGLCATFHCCRQHPTSWRDSSRLFCFERVPICAFDRDCRYRNASGVGSALFLLPRDCALAGRSDRRHPFPLLHSWRHGEPRGLAARPALDLRAPPVLWCSDRKGLHAQRQFPCQGPYVVCRGNILGHHPHVKFFFCLAFRRSPERMVFSVCCVLGLGDVGKQLDKSHR
jgi:hypothetical protein